MSINVEAIVTASQTLVNPLPDVVARAALRAGVSDSVPIIDNDGTIRIPKHRLSGSACLMRYHICSSELIRRIPV